MSWLNPLNWPGKILSLVSLVALIAVLHFFVAPWYYARDKDEKIKQAELKASALITARNLENERRKNEALTAQKQKLESNLADARSADAASASLLNNLRALQDRSQNDLTACRNYASTITELFDSIEGFSSWLAKEADGQALDKRACYDAWPK